MQAQLVLQGTPLPLARRLSCRSRARAANQSPLASAKRPRAYDASVRDGGLNLSRIGARQARACISSPRRDAETKEGSEDPKRFNPRSAAMVAASAAAGGSFPAATLATPDGPGLIALPNEAYGEVSAVLESSVLLLYLGGLLALLAFGTFLVVRQVLVRRELENAAKELQERVRTGQASSEEYFELGAVMLRKKFYTLANKYLLQAVAKWEGDEQELAQVHNALGFSYFSEDNYDKAVAEYEKAVKLQPAYATAWNNLGDAYEKKKDWKKALRAYESTLTYDPSNRIAKERSSDLQRKVEQLVP